MSEKQQALLTLQEVCQRLSIKKSHLRSLIFSKKIPTIKIGRLLRFGAEDVENWLNEQKRGLQN